MPGSTSKNLKRSAAAVTNDADASKKPATTPATLAESLDDLHFEDEFEDELSDEEDRLKAKIIAKERAKREAKAKRLVETKRDDGIDEDEDDEEEEFSDESGDEVEVADDATADNGTKTKKQNSKYVWRPTDGMNAEEQLDYDSTAYSMLHRLHTEWPCLSFDILPDALGALRVKYPHTVYLVCGTQADVAQKNKLMVMKIRDMHKTKHDDSDNEDEDDDETEPNANTNNDDDSDEEDDHLDDDPIPEERAIPHNGAINRVRVCPQHPKLVATMSDTRLAHIFDISEQIASLDASTNANTIKTAPIFTCRAHKDEGYALAWSPHSAGKLLSGDCAGGVYLWEPNAQLTQWDVSKESFKGHGQSVEDLAWSPSEATVFASASCDKTIRMWDIRMKTKCAAFVAAHKADVNVIAWNNLRQHLLASGADDGSMKVWDLRSFKSHTPAASFSWHQQSITSIEWHPQEDSILACSSEDNSLTVWDLSLETDAEEMAQYSRGAQVQEEIPPQLFFVHAGQQHIKELHWHKQVPGMIVTTAQDGFNLFKPENLE